MQLTVIIGSNMYYWNHNQQYYYQSSSSRDLVQLQSKQQQQQQQQQQHQYDGETTKEVQTTQLATKSKTGTHKKYTNNVADDTNYYLSSNKHSSTIECSTVYQNVKTGRWEDPNSGQHFIRQINTPPYHYVSVHSKEYDRVRYSSIFDNGLYYEHKVHNRFVSILQEEQTERSQQPVVIDVGANIGYYSLLSAAYSHPVISFEINPTNIIRICESIHWNQNYHHYHADEENYNKNGNNNDNSTTTTSTTKFGPIHIFRHGVSDKHNDTVKVIVPKRNPGEAMIRPIGKNKNRENNSNTSTTTTTNAGEYSNEGDHATLYNSYATTVTLDGFAKEHGWFSQRRRPNIAVLKIDTEGHEPQILLGARKLLLSGTVSNVLLEYRSSCKSPVLQYLLEAGYVLVYDRPDDIVGRPRTMLSKDASKGYIERMHKDGRFLDKDGNDNKYEDLWFRLESKKLPSLPRTKTTTTTATTWARNKVESIPTMEQ
jgi:hypothetical protein